MLYQTRAELLSEGYLFIIEISKVSRVILTGSVGAYFITTTTDDGDGRLPAVPYFRPGNDVLGVPVNGPTRFAGSSTGFTFTYNSTRTNIRQTYT